MLSFVHVPRGGLKSDIYRPETRVHSRVRRGGVNGALEWSRQMFRRDSYKAIKANYVSTFVVVGELEIATTAGEVTSLLTITTTRACAQTWTVTRLDKFRPNSLSANLPRQDVGTNDIIIFSTPVVVLCARNSVQSVVLIRYDTMLWRVCV